MCAGPTDRDTVTGFVLDVVEIKLSADSSDVATSLQMFLTCGFLPNQVSSCSDTTVMLHKGLSIMMKALVQVHQITVVLDVPNQASHPQPHLPQEILVITHHLHQPSLPTSPNCPK